MIYAFAPVGYQGELVRVESDLRHGIPGMDIIGLATGAVREARDRVRVALRNSGWENWEGRSLVSLSPADLIKNGGGYDLAIALSMLCATGQLVSPGVKIGAVGELSLNGELRPVPGVLAAGILWAEHGIQHALVPHSQAREASSDSRVKVWPLKQLSEASGVFEAILEGRDPQKFETNAVKAEKKRKYFTLRGQPELLRALEIAAAGGHHTLLAGPPGTGKTLAAQTLADLQPPLSRSEAVELNRIYSLAGLWSEEKGWISSRPMRLVSPGSSLEGLLGGGAKLRPGEISLAHGGVLFLDEALELAPSLLQSLRGPAQDGEVNIVRAGRSFRFPAAFQLMMTANPCPCGKKWLPQSVCLCSETEIHNYWKTLGGPLMDRIDLRAVVKPVDPTKLLGAPPTETAPVMARIQAAWEMQAKRNPAGLRNARLDPEEVLTVCPLDSKDTVFLTETAQRLGMSGRAVHGILKTARSAADLDGVDRVRRMDLELALRFRWFGEQGYRDEPLAFKGIKE